MRCFFLDSRLVNIAFSLDKLHLLQLFITLTTKIRNKIRADVCFCFNVTPQKVNKWKIWTHFVQIPILKHGPFPAWGGGVGGVSSGPLALPSPVVFPRPCLGRCLVGFQRQIVRLLLLKPDRGVGQHTHPGGVGVLAQRTSVPKQVKTKSDKLSVYYLLLIRSVWVE